MKKYILIIIVVIIWSCNNSKKIETVDKKVVKKELRPFFDSDEIEHYYLDFSLKDFTNHRHIVKPNNYEKEFTNLFTGNYPDNIPKEDFEKILLKHHYKKSKLNIKQQQNIKHVFSEKDLPIPDGAACIAEYRDIFIFKKKEKIIGISKICFKCNRFQIIGSKIDVSIFGFFEELDKLKKTVRPGNYSILINE